MTTSTAAAARAPNPFLSVLGRGLESVLNQVLGLDPLTRAELGSLDGRALRIEFRGTGIRMRLAVDGQRLRVGPGNAGESGLRVAATPGGLLGIVAARLFGSTDALPPGTLEIAGDAELARRIERLVTAFEPDVDEAFARVFGDVAGFQVARALRRGLAFARESAAALVHDGVDYLVEESRDLIAPAEMEQFLDEVDDLRERADRFEARLRRVREASAT